MSGPCPFRRYHVRGIDRGNWVYTDLSLWPFQVIWEEAYGEPIAIGECTCCYGIRVVRVRGSLTLVHLYGHGRWGGMETIRDLIALLDRAGDDPLRVEEGDA